MIWKLKSFEIQIWKKLEISFSGSQTPFPVNCHTAVKRATGSLLHKGHIYRTGHMTGKTLRDMSCYLHLQDALSAFFSMGSVYLHTLLAAVCQESIYIPMKISPPEVLHHPFTSSLSPIDFTSTFKNIIEALCTKAGRC